MVITRLHDHQYQYNLFTTSASLIASHRITIIYTNSDSLNKRVYVVIILILYEYFVCTVYLLLHNIDVPYNPLDHHTPMIDALMYHSSPEHLMFEAISVRTPSLEVMMIANGGSVLLLQFLAASSWT